MRRIPDASNQGGLRSQAHGERTGRARRDRGYRSCRRRRAGPGSALERPVREQGCIRRAGDDTARHATHRDSGRRSRRAKRPDAPRWIASVAPFPELDGTLRLDVGGCTGALGAGQLDQLLSPLLRHMPPDVVHGQCDAKRPEAAKEESREHGHAIMVCMRRGSRARSRARLAGSAVPPERHRQAVGRRCRGGARRARCGTRRTDTRRVRPGHRRCVNRIDPGSDGSYLPDKGSAPKSEPGSPMRSPREARAPGRPRIDLLRTPTRRRASRRPAATRSSA